MRRLIGLLLLAPASAWAQSGPCSLGQTGYISCNLDYSVNASAVPASGLSLLLTIPATARHSVEVMNESTGTIQVVRDDGAGNQVTSLFLGPAAGVGQQGGYWSSVTFQGRVRVYAVTGAQIAADQD